MLFFIAQLICATTADAYTLPAVLTTDVSPENQTWIQEQMRLMCPDLNKGDLRPFYGTFLNCLCLNVSQEEKNKVLGIFREHPLALVLLRINLEQLDTILGSVPESRRMPIIEKECEALNAVSVDAWQEYGRLLLEQKTPAVLSKKLCKELLDNLFDGLKTLDPSLSRIQKMSDPLMDSFLTVLSEILEGPTEGMKPRLDNLMTMMNLRWIQEQTTEIQQAFMNGSAPVTP